MHKKRLRAGVYLALLWSGTGVAGADALPQETPVPKFRLAYFDNALSAELSEVPLGDLLAELSRQSGVNVYFSGTGAAEKITARFENIPLEQAIRRILGHNYTLRYSRGDGPSGKSEAAPRLAEIHVLSRGSSPLSRQVQQRPPGLPGSVVPAALQEAPEDGSLRQWLQQAQQAEQPDARIAALRALAGLDRVDQGLPAFTTALGDADPKVREVALQLVEEKGILVPVKSLHSLALEDANPALRMRAWSQLAEQADPRLAAGYLAQAMTREQDAEVKGRAKQLLQQLLNKRNPPRKKSR